MFIHNDDFTIRAAGDHTHVWVFFQLKLAVPHPAQVEILKDRGVTAICHKLCTIHI